MSEAKRVADARAEGRREGLLEAAKVCAAIREQWGISISPAWDALEEAEQHLADLAEKGGGG